MWSTPSLPFGSRVIVLITVLIIRFQLEYLVLYNRKLFVLRIVINTQLLHTKRMGHKAGFL